MPNDKEITVLSTREAAETMREAEESLFRRPRGPVAIFARTIAILGGLFFLLDNAGIFSLLGFHPLHNLMNAIFLAIVLTLIFIYIPATKTSPKDRVPWYEIIPILGVLAGTAYIMVKAHDLVWIGATKASSFEAVLGYITVLVIMESVRRSFGWSMLIVTSFFLLYAKFGYLIPGPLSVYYYSWADVTVDFYLNYDGIFGGLTTLSRTLILGFIMFGVFFVNAGGSKFFLNLAMSVAGGTRGGPAKVAVLGSALFGTISGSGSANVVVTGTITIPMMKKIGYRPYYAAAVEAISSTGGMIMPPVMGAVAFIMAELLGVPYTEVALKATIPAVLFFLAIYVQVDMQAAKMGLKGIPREQLPSLKATLKEGWEFLLPLVVLVFVLFVIRYDPIISAMYTLGAVILVSLFRRENRITLRRFLDSVEGGVRSTLTIGAIIALAAVVLQVLVGTGLGPKLSSGLVTIFGGSAISLIIAAGFACYIMGMGVSLTASYILVAIVVAPALRELGLSLFVAHFFILYLTTSTMFTPPYAPNSYVAGAIAGADPFKVGFKAMQLGIVCYLVPFIVVLNPALLGIGNPGDIALGTVTALIGVIALSAAIEGHLLGSMNTMQRILFALGGLLTVIPGIATDLPGIAALIAVFLWHWASVRKQKAAQALPGKVVTPDS